MQFRQHEVSLFGFLVVPAFQIDLHEAVEQHLGGLQGVVFGPLVGRDPDGGVHHPGLAHLGGDGALPDQFIEFLFLRRPVDGRVLQESRADGLVGFLGALGLGPILARVGILFAEILQDEFLGRT